MAELIEMVRHWIEFAVSSLGYPGIVLVMAIENIFPPIPSELVMPFAGFLVNSGRFTLWGVILAGMIGSVIGAVALYYIGLWADELIIRRFIRQFGRFFLLTEDDVDGALNFFSRYGEAAIFFGRLVPIVRSLISVPAGMQRMSLPKFLFYTMLGTTIWSGLLAYGGMILGQNWPTIMDWIKQYERVILVLVILGVVGFVIFRINQLRTRAAARSSK